MPDEFLESLLRGERTMMRDPGACDLTADVFNTPTEPMTSDALLRALQVMYERPTSPWGAPSFSWFRRPPRRLSLCRVGGEWERQLIRSAWQEAGRSAWIESVRERLQSAVYAADNGYTWTWDTPGAFGTPDHPRPVRAHWQSPPPWRPEGGGADV